MSTTSIEKLGKIVKKIRKEQRLTQGELASIAGVGARFIGELERGKESCQMTKVFAVLSALGCTIEIDGKAL